MMNLTKEQEQCFNKIFKAELKGQRSIESNLKALPFVCDVGHRTVELDRNIHLSYSQILQMAEIITDGGKND